MWGVGEGGGGRFGVGWVGGGEGDVDSICFIAIKKIKRSSFRAILKVVGLL